MGTANVMNPQLLSADELKEWLDIKQSAALKRYLDRNNIPYIETSSGDPVTTLEVLNARLSRKNLAYSIGNVETIDLDFFHDQKTTSGQ